MPHETLTANWQKCLQFVRDYSSLDNSLRYPTYPFVFTILPIDPSKAVPAPASAASAATAAPVPAPQPDPAPAPTAPPPVQYPPDDQPL